MASNNAKQSGSQQIVDNSSSRVTISNNVNNVNNVSSIGHSFISGVNEVKNMETSLLTLLTSFHSGDLSAFGKGHSLETMEAVRAKQERLARLHFDLNSAKGQQQSGDASQNWLSDKDQGELVLALRELSVEIEKLHDTSS